MENDDEGKYWSGAQRDNYGASRISGTLCEKQFRDCVSNLPDDEVAQLVDYLDNVRFPLAFLDSGLVYNHPRSYVPWILQVPISGNPCIGSDGYAVLGERYRNLAKSQTLPF